MLEVDPYGWENYRSAESDLEVCATILQNMVKEAWALSFTSTDALCKHLGVEGVILNELGLVTKIKPDGTTKHHLVWDLRRSGVNRLIPPGERIVLPRVQDLIEDAFELHRAATAGERLFLFGTDVPDAFHQVPPEPIGPEVYGHGRRGHVLRLPGLGLWLRQCPHSLGQVFSLAWALHCRRRASHCEITDLC